MYSSAKVSNFRFTQIIFSFILDFLIFKNVPDLLGAIGTIIVAGSTIFVAYKQWKSSKQSKPSSSKTISATTS